jgi:predicted secreted Zn-dependent protease
VSELRILVGLCLAAIATATPALGEVKSSTVIKYYDVPGTNLPSLARFVAKNPLHFRSTGALGRTDAAFDFSLLANQHGAACTATDAEISMSFTITIPRATEKSLRPQDRVKWREFVAFVRRHEEMHRTIYVQCMQSFERTARRMSSPGGCEALTTLARQRFNDALLACQQRHESLDARDGRSLLRLPFFRSLR